MAIKKYQSIYTGEQIDEKLTQVDTKADQTEVDSSIETINNELANKADITYVNSVADTKVSKITNTFNNSFVYGNDVNLGETKFIINNLPNAWIIPQYSDKGVLKSNDPYGNSPVDVINLRYANANYARKPNRHSSESVVSVLKTNGEWESAVVTSNPSAAGWSIVQREGNGYILAKTPTADNHVANKAYVDANAGGSKDTQKIITYSELKTLRDSGTLVPGQQYRITDYQCTTAQENTTSARHQFDIIVVADSESVLNENARAIQHAGDTYFAKNDLATWELKYSLDNDTSRFVWADLTNGKGVIYYMKDEFNNECPYDFKNILFTGSSFDGSVSFTNAYTFTYTENSTLKDASLAGLTTECYNNVIKEYYTSNKLQLNRNIFYSIFDYFKCYSNTFGNNCYENIFSTGCRCNIFGNDCYDNTFRDRCYSNTFRDKCYGNTFGADFQYNIFGNDCQENTFGSNCYRNTFGNGCHNNIFGTYFRYNTFGNNCQHNTFGSWCNDNTFGNYCYYITFGRDCQYNTFGSYCYYITFGTSSGTISYCKYNIIDNGCKYLYINSTDTGTDYDRYLQNIHIHLGVCGSSSSNRLTVIIPDRALEYEYNVVKTGTTTVEI